MKTAAGLLVYRDVYVDVSDCQKHYDRVFCVCFADDLAFFSVAYCRLASTKSQTVRNDLITSCQQANSQFAASKVI